MTAQVRMADPYFAYGRRPDGETAAPKPLPVVRAVVVSSVGGPNLAACLESLAHNGFPGLRVTVADNASPDGAAKAAASLFPEIDVARNAKNLGFAGGANTGLRQAMAEGARYALALNDDVTLMPGCVRALVEAMEADPGLGACQPLILDAADPSRQASAGCRACLTGRCGDLGAGDPVMAARSPSLARPVVRLVPAVTGAAMLLRVEELAGAGLFDERFFMYFEDVDLSFKLKRLGFETGCALGATALHVGGATAGKLPAWRRIARCERNALALAARHYPPLLAALALALGPMSSLAAAAFRLAIGRPMDALAYAAGSAAGLALGLAEAAGRLAGRGLPGSLPQGLIERRRIFP
jgi:hypothetical protein